MATNNFKPFATAANANVTAQADWEALPALLSGFMAGKASSAQVNKAIRQASFIAAALAQYTANKSGLDVLDDGDLNGFISKMGTAFGKDFQALDATLTALAGLATGANKLPYFNGTDTAALTDFTAFARTLLARSDADSVLSDLGLIVTEVGKNIISAPTKVDVLSYLGITTALDGKQPLDATLTALAELAGVADKLPYFNGADTAALTDLTAYARGLLGAPDAADSRSYLGLKSAATKDVGNGAGQVPDMSSWVSGGSPTTGWRKTPDGYIEQWGLTGATTTDVTINFPIPFPTALISINEHDMAPSGESMSMWQFREVTLNNCVAVNLGTLIRGNPSLGSPVASGCRWFAKGI